MCFHVFASYTSSHQGPFSMMQNRGCNGHNCAIKASEVKDTCISNCKCKIKYHGGQYSENTRKKTFILWTDKPSCLRSSTYLWHTNTVITSCLQKLYVRLSHREVKQSKVSHLHTGSVLAPPLLEVLLELDLCPLQQQLQVLNLYPQRF